MAAQGRPEIPIPAPIQDDQDRDHGALKRPGLRFAQIAKSLKPIFTKIQSTKGGVNGRPHQMMIADDAYSPPKTVEQTRRLVRKRRGVADLRRGRGRPDQQCRCTNISTTGKVPQLFLWLGCREVGTIPKVFPWTDGLAADLPR